MLRTRSSSNRQAINGTYITDAGCSSPSSTTAFVGYDGVRKETIDWVEPGALAKLRRGEFVNNRFSSNTVSTTSSGKGPAFNSTAIACPPSKLGYWSHDTNFGYYFCGYNDPYYTPGGAVSASDKQALITEVTTSLWSQMRGADANLLVDVAEIRSTLEMLRDPFSAMHALARKSQKRSGIKNIKEAVAGTWLEYRYGWLPLISSVDGVITALKRPNLLPRRRVHDSMKIASSVTSTTTWPSSVVGSGAVTQTNMSTEEYSVRPYAIYVDNRTTQNHLGIDLGGAISLGWELVPYSFVADWFANTGTFLEGLGAYYTTRLLVGGYTERSFIRETKTALNTTAISGRTVNRSANYTGVSTQLFLNRVPTLPPPNFTIKPKTFSVEKPKHVLDGIALLSQFR